MPLINLQPPRITTAQLKYLELLIDRLEDRTWKLSVMPRLLGNNKCFFAYLTKEEASLVINELKRELGDTD